MNRIPIPIWLIFFSLFLLLRTTTSVEDEVKNSLLNFLAKLSNNSSQLGSLSSWSFSSDPCKDHWPGVVCDSKNTVVRKLYLNSSKLDGELDVGFLCGVAPLAASLGVVHLEYNSINGGISTEILSCKQLTHFHVTQNKLSGSLPASLVMLNNMKQLDISNNRFSGSLPDFSRISGLQVFLAENNQLGGEIPVFDFSNLKLFNVSNNNLTGRIPDVHGHFTASSFLGNPYLCGDPLPIECPPSQADTLSEKSKGSSKSPVTMFVGYIVLGLAGIALFIFMLCKRSKRKDKVNTLPKKVVAVDDEDDSLYKSSFGASMESTVAGLSKSGISADQSALVSSSVLVVLTSPEVNGLKFEDLLRAPAEMLGRGKSGCLYKVLLDNNKNVVVKRIKDWPISSHEFKQRMQRLDKVKHPNVLPALAFYSSKQEKLLVYEFQQNGNLFKFLHGTNMDYAFDWATRLEVAANIAEALAFMHQELKDDKITHGNLKSSNILLNKNMEPCISEYGLMRVQNSPDNSLLAKVSHSKSSNAIFKDDVYGFGVILLELLTGNLVQHNGIDLTDWVQSVVREEWTVEVFDKALLSECASVERLVSLLQVAIQCVNRSPEARPSMNQVAAMINTIKDEDERSAVSFEP
ncbi:probable inactive receptor kinase At2g26730 [Humulus lupulus]|uniref:probable inactive receptor kinase At2g26730 n=1 Tax=Humulus lupulus TaxID=3486 RepID=UPI002B40A3AF|nr:probable inactive receptor kinase At2g26730 [Humulus lupulus]